MTTPFLAHDIEFEEGRRTIAYQDRGGVWTIGVGHTGPEVHEGLIWTDAQINDVLARDIAKACAGLDRVAPWWRTLDGVRQDVVVQMTFQMGPGWTRKFPKACRAMIASDWQTAHDEMLNSDWARVDSPSRAKRMADQMLTGERSWG